MARVMLLLVLLLAVGLVLTVQPARAQMGQPATVQSGEYRNVSGIVPFTATSNFMSVPGLLRWQTFQDQGRWISYSEAREVVVAQGGELYHRA